MFWKDAVKRALAAALLLLTSTGVAEARASDPPHLAPWLRAIEPPEAMQGPPDLARGLSAGFPLVIDGQRVLMIHVSPIANRLEAAMSRDGGTTWTAWGVIEENPDSRIRVGRPVALRSRDGTLWVFYYGWVKYTKDPATSESNLWAIRSVDGGRTWTDRRVIWKGYAGMLQGVAQSSSGAILLPFCYLAEATRFANGVMVSRDQGANWTFVPVIDVPASADAQRRAQGLNGGALEPAIVQLRDGRLWYIARTITGRIWQSYSADDGRSWSTTEPTALSCGGPIFLTRLASGRLALVWNQADWSQDPTRHFPWNFHELSIALSDDDGESWSVPVVFVRGPREVHAFLAESSPGQLLITLPTEGLLLRGSEDDLVSTIEAAEFQKPRTVQKYISRADAPQTWAGLYRYAQENRALAGTSQTGRVIFIGDSITDYWDLARFFPGKPYVNRGIRGQTTGQMLLRFFPDVIALKPAVAVIFAGANDIARTPGPNVPNAMVRDNIRAMTQLARRNGVRVVLCSVLPVSDSTGIVRSESRPKGVIEAHNDWLRQYAAEEGVALADTHEAVVDDRGMLRTGYSRDGVHPNERGYAAMVPVVDGAIVSAMRESVEPYAVQRDRSEERDR